MEKSGISSDITAVEIEKFLGILLYSTNYASSRFEKLLADIFAGVSSLTLCQFLANQAISSFL